ncbi:MAG: carbamoyl-phosphate synthase (glutamine-hydrolyzing) small subunit, partial [Bacteroidales bacterium]|nr:carbamoyl-phosphate synthase (glutamine-hydrolyzing) small subunit [Bacteroidales bacterium]
MSKAKLILSDGSSYDAFSFGYEQSVSGELVFYTAMTGYPESLSDPSYKGQILIP